MPLMKKPPLEDVAHKLMEDVQKDWRAEYDVAGSIGKRYRRQDEIGTPYCLTVDFDTLDDKAVTVRNRDTMEQERVALDQIKGYLKNQL